GLRDDGRRHRPCRTGHRPIRRVRWTAGSNRDQAWRAGHRIGERASHHPLTAYVLNPQTLRASGALFFWAAIIAAVPHDELAIASTEARGALTRRSGIPAAPAFAAQRSRGAERPLGASVRAAAA